MHLIHQMRYLNAIFFQNNAVPHVFQEGKHAVDMWQFFKIMRYTCGNFPKLCDKYAVIFQNNAVKMRQFFLDNEEYMHQICFFLNLRK